MYPCEEVIREHVDELLAFLGQIWSKKLADQEDEIARRKKEDGRNRWSRLN